MIPRRLEKNIKSHWNDRKVIIVLGPRQVGKTTLLENLCKAEGDYLFWNGDDFTTRQSLEDIGEVQIRQLIGSHQTLFIDEAQRIKNIGIVVKIIHDRIKNVRVIVSGSSALELSSTINEPLTGRKWQYKLYPISWGELIDYYGVLGGKQQFETRLIYGMYPDIINNLGNERYLLEQLVDSYLYKDLLSHNSIRKPEILSKLLTALALQLGSEVSYNELSQLLKIDRATVENYLQMLEMAFVVFKLPPLSRNMRNEISSSRKIYFYDNGVRNAIIGNFNLLALRNDVGALWENFLISERMKMNHYNQTFTKSFFWRNHAQQEIDYIEERDGNMLAYEFKWKEKPNHKFPSSFTESYKPKETRIIDQNNFESFLL